MSDLLMVCSLCGLAYVTEYGGLDIGEMDTAYFECPDTVSCAERWLVKFLDGRGMDIESITLVEPDSSQPPTFAVEYGLPKRTRSLTLVVWTERDVHRALPHYHVMEQGRDVTSVFAH